MNVQEIRQIAHLQGIQVDHEDKLKLIRAIQHHEGNFECFGTALQGRCDQANCLWRKDCLSLPRFTQIISGMAEVS